MKEKFYKYGINRKTGWFVNRKNKDLVELTYRTIDISDQSIGKRDGLEQLAGLTSAD